MSKNFFIAVIVFFIGTIDIVHGQTSKGFTLDGNIKGMKDGIKLYLVSYEDKDTLSRSITKDGKFHFEGKVPFDAQFYFIRIDTLIKRTSSKALMLTNNSIKVTGDFEEWPLIEVTGSIPHNEFLELRALHSKAEIVEREAVESAYKAQEEPYKMLQEARAKGDTVAEANAQRKFDEIAAKIKAAENVTNGILLKFVNNHRNSLYVSNLILKMEGRLTFDEMVAAYNSLTPEAKNSYYGIKLNEILKYGEMKIGNVAADFTGITPDGDSITLKEVVAKGRYTLLDFWASWCGPCRVETPFVKRAYNMYHSKGFNVISVTSDSDLDDWKKAIEKDKMTWYHVINKSTKGGDAFAIQKVYNIIAIPKTYLLDKEGRIIEMDLRGEELVNRIRQLMN